MNKVIILMIHLNSLAEHNDILSISYSGYLNNALTIRPAKGKEIVLDLRWSVERLLPELTAEWENR